MSTPRPSLPDALLRQVLARRAAGPSTSAELLDDVLAAVETLPQRHGWTWRLASEQRLLPILLVAALLLSALIGFALVAGGSSTRDAGGGEIMFVHASYDPTRQEPPSNPVIFGVPSGGGDPTPLRAVPGTVSPPRPAPIGGAGVARFSEYRNLNLIGPAVSWSPDGTQVAFRLFNDAPGIYVMNPDGSELRRLVDLPEDVTTNMPFSAALDWSPDGSRIAYTYPYGPTSSIYVADVDDDRPPTRLGPLATRTVAWSPDGSKLAFVRRDSHVTTGLFVVSADGTGERRLTDKALSGHPDAIGWSPDGSKIAFVRDDEPTTDSWALHVVNVDGSGLRNLGQLWWGGCCTFAGLDQVLEWSPDGELIALIDGRDDATHPGEYVRDVIVLVEVDGSGERVLAEGSYFDWSPDGSRLVVSEAGSPMFAGRPDFSNAGFDSYSIYVINADGTGRRWLAEGEYPAWSPASGG